MIYLKIGLGLVCLALGANLVFLIHKWMPQIDLKILIGVVILFLLPCITFNTLFPAFYFHFFCLLLIMQLVYFLFHKPVNLLLFLIPLLLTSSILGYGIYNLHHIKPTSYTLFTDKDIKPTKIVFLADLHYPTGMTPYSLTKLVSHLEKENPDFYALGGDIVDEFTTKDEMEPSLLNWENSARQPRYIMFMEITIINIMHRTRPLPKKRSKKCFIKIKSNCFKILWLKKKILL